MNKFNQIKREQNQILLTERVELENLPIQNHPYFLFVLFHSELKFPKNSSLI